MTQPTRLSRLEKNKMNRRQFIKLLGTGAVVVTLAASFYSLFLDRIWIQTTQRKLSFKRLPQSFKNLKVVQISDLHLGYYISSRQIAKMVQLVNEQKPDLICFTGDLVEDELTDVEQNIPALQSLQAKYGKIAILGNHDYRAGKVDQVIQAYRNCGFTFLQNRNTFIEKEGQRLYIAGLDDLFGGMPNVEQAIQGIPADAFTLLLAHEPDMADTAAGYPIDFQLSGHSHGGQVCLPFIGALYRPDGAQKYVRGLKKIASSDLLLYVNRGIGTTHLPIRFDCRPEITVFTLNTV